jgi:hypothetical protein
MVDEARPNGGVRVSQVDRQGTQILPSVHSAAEAIASRAIACAERLHIDAAIAANVLEEAAARVSRQLQPGLACEKQIRDLHSYLFCVFLRLINTKQTQSLVAAGVISNGFSAGSNSVDPRTWLDGKILIDELLLRCDPLIREMWSRRIEGFSWKEIGGAYGISGHAAESKFSKALQKIRRRLGLK